MIQFNMYQGIPFWIFWGKAVKSIEHQWFCSVCLNCLGETIHSHHFACSCAKSQFLIERSIPRNGKRKENEKVKIEMIGEMYQEKRENRRWYEGEGVNL